MSRLQHRAVFFRSLGAMFESGVPLMRALEQLTEQSEDRKLQAAAAGLAKGLHSGKALSRAMGDFPTVFTAVQRRLIHAGEQSGRLGHVLNRLAQNEEQLLSVQQKITQSLVTPAIVCIVCLAMVIVLPPVFLRGLLTMLVETGVQLPWPTQMLLWFSNMVCKPWFLPLLAIAGCASVWGGMRLVRNDEIRHRLWTVLMRIPTLGPTLRSLATIRFGHTLSSMLDSGNTLLVALPLAAQSSGNPLLEGSIGKAVEALKEGENLCEALSACDFFPRTFLLSLRAGEESGNVSRLMVDLMKLMELELQQRIDTFTALLEPLVMLVVGVIVGFVVVATLLPMLKMVESL